MRVACPKFMRGRSLEVFGKFNHAFYAVDRRWSFTYVSACTRALGPFQRRAAEEEH
jgi:hypothetical protein